MKQAAMPVARKAAARSSTFARHFTPSRHTLQTAVRIGSPDDPHEREADHIADQALAASTTIAGADTPLRAMRSFGQGPGVDSLLSGPGTPLEQGLRWDMEQRFGHDFSRVRVHTAPAEAQSARDVHALAYTLGSDIVFAENPASLGNSAGRRLLAHELAHVVQQLGRPTSELRTIRRKATPPKRDGHSGELGALQTARGGAKAKLPLTPRVVGWVAALQSGDTNPESPPENDPSKYPERRQEGEAFVWGEKDPRAVDPTDVEQGYLGDCYFMALLAAIAQVRPEAIEQMVTPNDDGTFTVSFFGPDGKRVNQKVEPTFPSYATGAPAYAKFGDQSETYGRELWPMLIEKGWMQAHGAWLKIEGSKVSTKEHAIAMTGAPREEYSLPGKLSDDALFERLSHHFLAKQPVTVFSPKATAASKKKALKSGVITNHAYALRNVYPSSKTIDLYNPWGPESKHLNGTNMAFLKANFRTVVFFTFKGVSAGVSAAGAGPTMEEALRAEAVPREILKASGYDILVGELETQLPTVTSASVARSVVLKFGQGLWDRSKARAQDPKKASSDDRPLYWARLAGAAAVRTYAPTSYNLTLAEKSGLLDALEASSRGRTDIVFPAGGPDASRRVLVSGFDPFALRSQGLRKANPSGAAVLALDGHTISGGPGAKDGRVEGVIFPVRFADFDRAIVETTFRPYLTGPKRVDMVMTISQGGSTLDPAASKGKQSEAFELEKYAGRRRAPSGADNVDVDPVGSSGLKEGKRFGKGPEFLESSLPRKAMVGREETKAESEKEQTPSGELVGSGGGFLSNEIFYRTALLKTEEKSSVPVGHLHVPNLPAPKGDPKSEAQHTKLRDLIVSWVKKLIANALKWMGGKKTGSP